MGIYTVKFVWAAFITLIILLFAFSLAQLLLPETHQFPNNTLFRVSGDKVSVNWDLLSTMNSSYYRRYVEEPLACNQTIAFRGSIVEYNRKTYETINEDCLRGLREYGNIKTLGKTRVVLLGDSFFYGSGVSDNETVAALLESKYGFEAINLAVPGYNTKLEVKRLVQKGLKYQPDIIVLGYVDNDFEDARLLRQMDHYLFEYLKTRNYTQEECWAVRSQIDWISHFPFESTFNDSVETPLSYLRNITQGIPVVIVSYPLEWVIPEGEYLAIMRGISISNNFSFFYLEEEIGYNNSGIWIQHPQDTHPTPYANKKTAEFLAGKINAII